MPNPKKVLVVEDSLAFRKHLFNIVSKAGYEVLEAEDGLAALKQLQTHPDTSAVIADIIMPKMDGIKLIEEMHKDQNLLKIPVIVVSTSENSEEVKKAREAGARGWLVKPFSPGQLITVIKKYEL